MSLASKAIRARLAQGLKVLAVALGGGLVCLGLVFAWFLLTTPAPPPIPRTTAQDDTLPALTIDGFRFHLETHGDPVKPVVIVLHGGPGNDYRYLLPLSALAQDYFVVFYDQRGAGLSPRVPEADLTLERFVADLDAIGRTFSADKPVRLIGHSWGAMLATAYLARHPERVSHAVLAEPGFLTPELGNRFVKTLDERSGFSMASLGALLHAAASAVKLPGPDVDIDARLDHLGRELSRHGGPGNPVLGYFCGRDLDKAYLPSWRPGVRSMVTMLGRASNEDGQVVLDLSRGIEAYRREVLLVSGSCNEIIGPEVQEQHRRLFPQARLAVIQGAGHTMFGERPDESLSLIRQYFAGAQ
jgi:proline iminopeptidase